MMKACCVSYVCARDWSPCPRLYGIQLNFSAFMTCGLPDDSWKFMIFDDIINSTNMAGSITSLCLKSCSSYVALDALLCLLFGKCHPLGDFCGSTRCRGPVQRRIGSQESKGPPADPKRIGTDPSPCIVRLTSRPSFRAFWDNTNSNDRPCQY